MGKELEIEIRSPTKLNLSMQSGSGTTNYNRLANRPQINGITLSGNQTVADLRIVSEDTTAGWNDKLDYVPKRGEIVLYTDRETITDEQGNTIMVPGIKIGDGNAYLVDLPFQDEATRSKALEELKNHEANTSIHVTEDEKEFWNAKLNYDVAGDELIFTRL